MKNKPKRHKESNTFKFQPFSERIANVDVDVFHRVGHKYENDCEEYETYFHKALDKWHDLNLTESFEAFQKEVPPTHTLPQLLQQKDDVVALLLKYIKLNNPLCLQPVLELVVAVARDLQHEFYPYYSEFVHNLIELLHTKDTDVLDWTFTCLAYLSKFLWRYLVKDVRIVFTDLLPLLHDSRPDYINNFAAESFAFVARKVKDKRAFLLLVLKTLKKNREGVAGCGRLLFEVIHGVAGQFHSCAAVMLPLVFEMLADKSISQSLLFEVLGYLVAAMVKLIQPKKSGLFWMSAFKTVGSFVSMWEKGGLESHEPICLLLKLVLQAVTYKNAVFVSDPVLVAQHIIELLKLQVAEDILLVSSEIGAALLMSSIVSLPQEYATRIILKVLAVPYTGVLLVFVQKVLTYPAFEVLVLPHLMFHCQSISSNDSVVGVVGIGQDFLYLLTRLVLHKAPLCRTGMDLQCWHQYPLNFRNGMCRSDSGTKTISVPSQFLDVLCVNDINELLMGVEDFLCVTICLPHIKQLDQDVAMRELKHDIILLCSSLKRTSNTVGSKSESDLSRNVQRERTCSPNEVDGSEENLRISLLVLATVLETVIHLTDDKMLKEVCNLDMLVDSLLPYACDTTNLSALRALDLYFTAYKLETEEAAYCLELFRRLLSELLNNLSSPFHEVRMLTLHLFSLFEQVRGSDMSEEIIGWPVFSLCLSAELVQPTVHEYRKKLQHLENLEFTAIHAHLLRHPEYSKVPIYFLLGNLYINFQLLWEPTIKLIASYAQGMNITEFWEVFGEKLHLAAQQIKVFNQEKVPLLSFKCDFLLDFFSTLNPLDDKPDHINYRLLLWKAMLEFPDVCETKNRDLSPLFLKFLEEEYYRSNSEIASSWSIKIRNVCVEEKEGDDVELMETEEELEDVELMAMKKELREFPESSYTSARAMLKTLLAHMNIFTKMKNPRSIYREPDLNRAYLDFLTHKNPEVQKMALDCLVSYKPKYLLPYREHLYGLIDDKTFKTELTVFQIGKASELIQTEHRTELMPFVMRILFSKMLTRTGVKSAGTGQLRYSLVLRFLAGCHESEMFLFVEMAFKIFAKFTQDDPVMMVDSILDSLDIEHIIPPKRLQSSLNLLSVVMEKFGRLMGQRLLPYLLRVLFCISAIVQGALACKDMVHRGYLTTLVTLRNSCQGIAARFFEHFDNYAWSEDEVDTVFRILVWPWLEKLPVEGIHSPTALLKLFLVWSKQPRYFVLLAKHADGNKGLTPLPYIMNLLLRKQTHRSVTTAVMELVERLLTLQDHQEEVTEDTDVAPNITVQQKLHVDSEAVLRLSLCENLNYGSCLLLPHIPAILEYLEHKLGSLKHRSLGPRDLVILSRATELVWDAATSDTLLRLLLPQLGRKAHSGEERVSHLITTLDNLFRNVTQPEKHLRSLAPLFGVVSTPGPRRLLNKLLITIAKCCSEEKKTHFLASAQLISKLNAFDAKWVEQPDFNQRLDGFKEVHDMLEKGQIDVELGVIIIHNCFHFIRIEKDLSLKDSAGYCLCKVAPAVCLKYRDVASDVKFLVSDTVLLLACAGIRDKNETVQQESIRLLGEMARECNELHPVLQDLSKLANKADPEVDFFENLLHLQSHRKSRALLKFCQVAKGLTKAPNPQTLTHFILPLASAFLCSEKYAHKNSIVDAAVETIGTVCRLLPWLQYETSLRFYLAKLRYQVDFQKQLVRTVVAILDAFHFDLSRAHTSAIEDKSENIEAGEVELMQMEVTDKKEVSINGISNPSGSVMTIPINKRHEESGETGILYSVESNANKAIEEAGPEELLDRLECQLELEDALCKVEEKECDATCEMASAPVPVVNRDTILSKSVATQVIHTITTGLLPQIHHVMAQLTQEELFHKVNKKHTSDKEDESILRVPIALAAVKLLQRLPSHMLDQNLPGILLKLCTFLKSRLESVRRVTRETLQKIMLTLGPKYLGILLHEMSVMLTRGYQVHVLIYTIHAVLISLKNLFQPGDIDCNLQGILELCKKDLFGAVAEEKEVNQITGKLQEARKTKSYDTFQILAQTVTEKCLFDLIVPLREILSHTHSFKVIHKCSECLRRIVLGLADNTFVPVESLLVFMYGIASESIPDLSLGLKKEEITPAQKELLSRQRPDSFIIPQAPKNCSGFNITARTSTRTNAHVLVEFGLRLFHILLKREKLRTGDFRPYVDPMVPILCDCFRAQHIKVTTVALHCMGWILRMDLPALRENIQNVAALIFKLLHKYAAAGLSKGDNFDLVVAAFKVVAVLVRDVKYHVIGAEQVKALLLYAEQDMYDFNRQAAAFALLKAVLARKLVAPEIHDVMNKVAKLSITSEFAHIRLQSRQVFHQFLLNYPLGKKLEHHLAFYISQLNYEVQSGRESALEMMLSVITSFPIDVLTTHSCLLFITLGAQLVNDDSPECRKMVAHCLKTMLERLHRGARNQLFDVVIVWLKDKKVEHRRLAAQLCGIFITVEKSDFENRLPKLFSLLVQQFNSDFIDDNQPGRYVRIAQSNVGSPAELHKDEQMGDHLLFQVLQLLLKVCTFCPHILTELKWQDDLETVAENAQGLLAHPHEWVRLAAAQLLGHIFCSLNVNKVAVAVASRHHSVSRNECGYFYRASKQRLKSLVLDLCAQLQPHEVTAELVEQVVKNLVFLGRVLKNVSVEGHTEETEEQDSEEKSDNQTKLSLLWMIQRMRKIVNVEIVQAPKSTAMRTAVFQWIGAIALDLGCDGLPPVAYQLLALLSRELVRSDESDSGKQLCQLAKQVSDLIKKKLGMEVYMQHISRLQIGLATRRADRKKRQAQQVLTDPERAAKRKIKKQLKKREVKKKRIEKIKGPKFSRKKRKEFKIEDI